MTAVPSSTLDESHVFMARDVIAQMLAQGAPFGDLFMLAVAMIRELALGFSPKPGELYANAIYAIAQLVPPEQRDPAVKAVLDHLAELMEPSNV